MRFPHIATYWAPLPADKFGKATFMSPIEIPCRWEDMAEEFVSVAGNTETSTSIVYTLKALLALLVPPVAPEDILTLGAMRHATIDLSDPKPTEPWAGKPNTWEIRRVGNAPNMRGTKELIAIYLGTKRSYLPTSRT